MILKPCIIPPSFSSCILMKFRISLRGALYEMLLSWKKETNLKPKLKHSSLLLLCRLPSTDLRLPTQLAFNLNHPERNCSKKKEQRTRRSIKALINYFAVISICMAWTSKTFTLFTLLFLLFLAWRDAPFETSQKRLLLHPNPKHFIAKLSDNEFAFIFEIGSRKRWQQQHQTYEKKKRAFEKSKRNEQKKLIYLWTQLKNKHVWWRKVQIKNDIRRKERECEDWNAMGFLWRKMLKVFWGKF